MNQILTLRVKPVSAASGKARAKGLRSLTSSSDLGEAPIGRLMLRLALPSIMAQLINILYNIVDRMYIGRIAGAGSLALTGLGVAFPIITLVSAFAQLMGMGGAPLAAIQLGAGDRQRAERILQNSALLLLIATVACTAGFLAFKRPLLFMFGASPDTITYAEDYLGIYLAGTISVMLALGLNPFITAQGQARVAMLSVMIGAAANVALDPLFIFTFGMGVKGAALATVISQTLSAAWVVWYLCSHRSALRLRLRGARLDGAVVRRIIALGVSPFIMQATESAISITFNVQLRAYGNDLYVGSMTILQSVMQILFVPMNGFTQGVQPIISYNYGAGQFKRVMATFRRMTVVTLLAGMALATCAMTMPELFARVFTDNEELIGLVKQVLPIYISGMLIFGLQSSCQMTFVGMGQAKVSLFIACLRKIILLIPLILLLPLKMGVMGIYWAEPIADVTSAICATLIFAFTHRRMLTPEALSRQS